MKKPIHKVGDSVKMKSPSLYGETTGVVTEVQRTFKELDKMYLREGKEVFDEDGMAWLENTIDNRPNFEIDGDYFTIYTDNTKTVVDIKLKFIHWAYTIKTEKMNCIYSAGSVFK